MTYSELVDKITVLGFRGAIEDALADSLVDTINISLREIYFSRKIERTVRLSCHGLTPIFRRKEITCLGGDILTLPLRGEAFSMRVHGSCQYMLADGLGGFNVYAVDSPNETTSVKGFIPQNTQITIWSNFSFTIYDFSVYDHAFSQKAEDIPDGGDTVCFDLRKMYGDFLYFVSPAKDVNGLPLYNCRLKDGKVEIDSTYKGEILVTYCRLPAKVAGIDYNEEIDIPEEYTHLLPLLVASYLLIGYNDGLAVQYRESYEECISKMNLSGYSCIDSEYMDTNGWA